MLLVIDLSDFLMLEAISFKKHKSLMGNAHSRASNFCFRLMLKLSYDSEVFSILANDFNH